MVEFILLPEGLLNIQYYKLCIQDQSVTKSHYIGRASVDMSTDT